MVRMDTVPRVLMVSEEVNSGLKYLAFVCWKTWHQKIPSLKLTLWQGRPGPSHQAFPKTEIFSLPTKPAFTKAMLVSRGRSTSKTLLLLAVAIWRENSTNQLRVFSSSWSENFSQQFSVCNRNFRAERSASVIWFQSLKKAHSFHGHRASGIQLASQHSSNKLT